MLFLMSKTFFNTYLSPLQEELTGGIELEPLLAIRRRKAKKYPLSTTDVTGPLDIKPK